MGGGASEFTELRCGSKTAIWYGGGGGSGEGGPVGCATCKLNIVPRAKSSFESC